MSSAARVALQQQRPQLGVLIQHCKTRGLVSLPRSHARGGGIESHGLNVEGCCVLGRARTALLFPMFAQPACALKASRTALS